MPDPRIESLLAAGWKRQGPFYSPPGSSSKYTLEAAAGHLSRALSAQRPTADWRKAAIADWLSAHQISFDETATKRDLLDLVTTAM